MITKEQRQELRNLAEKASHGNWGELGPQTRTFDPDYASKMNFIAAASPAVVVALLDHLESAIAVIEGWRPIDTAPKDGVEILLFYPAGAFPRELIEKGWWCDDRYANRPKPYWTNSSERMWSIKRCRDNPPTHWMPLPLTPGSGEVGKHV